MRGRGSDVIDGPAMVGMVSRDGQRAVAVCYEHASSAYQNADDHHCLHSHPAFGDIPPGSAVTRRGCVLFGDDLESLAEALRVRLAS